MKRPIRTFPIGHPIGRAEFDAHMDRIFNGKEPPIANVGGKCAVCGEQTQDQWWMEYPKGKYCWVVACGGVKHTGKEVKEAISKWNKNEIRE